MTDLHHPLRSLREGHWFKLICGASFQYLPAIRNLTLAYTLAGADCIDVAADPAVIVAAREALQAAQSFGSSAQRRGFAYQGTPWLMVSLNDGEDPHFRKAEFDVAGCPEDCLRPCEVICPAQAIVFQGSENSLIAQSGEFVSGVLSDRCYGCGRCLPVCPVQHISTRSHVFTPETIAPLVLEGVDALEIHTQIGRLANFKRLWQAISPWLDRLKLIAVSCADGDGLIDYLWELHRVMQPLPVPLIWQTDGRPMSGDIGIGTTRAAVKLGQKVLAAGLPGYVQLAGGTNQHTVVKLRELGCLRDGQALPGEASLPPLPFIPSSSQSSLPYIAGVAYGSYARVLLSSVLEELEALESVKQDSLPDPHQAHSQVTVKHDTSTIVVSRSNQTIRISHLETFPDLLWQAVSLASSLTSQLKTPMKLQSSLP